MVDEIFMKSDVQHAVGECEICPGSKLQMQTCGLRCVSASRINDNQLAAVCMLLFKPLHDRRKRVRAVRSPQHPRFRLRNIANWERQAAINTESLILGRR